jgi:hypothetical protein
MKIKLLLLLTFFVSALSWGQAFTATYTFESVTTTSGTTDPTTPPTATGVTFGSFSANGTPANPNAPERFSFIDWNTGATNGNNTFTGSINTSKYYEVTIAPASGYTLDINSITFTIQRSGTGIRQYAVRSSLDYTNNLPASISPANVNLSVVATFFFQIRDSTTNANNGSTITLGSNYDLLSSAVTFRFYGWNAEASGGTFSIDNVVINGVATLASTNDTDSEIDGPVLAGQPDPVLVSSLIDTDAEAIPVFNFDVYDYGTDDGEPTKITQVTIKPGSNNTANWANTIGGVKLSLDGGATFVTTGTPTITAGSIAIPITSGNLDIPDNDALTVSMFMYLRNSGLVDNSILEFSIPATTHGFTTHPSGSAFAATFPSTTVSNEMLIDVVRTRLTITTQPTTTACPFSNLDTAAVFSATDANGNVDTDFTGLVTVTNSGSILMSGNSVNAVAGVATFTNLQFQNTGNVTLTASATGITNSAATNAIAISVANVTAAAATNGNASSVISWTNPTCRDEILIVVKANSAVTTSPSGNGTAYTGNLNFGSGTAFDGGYVVYKGNASPQTLLNLTNGTTYHITFFTRRGTSWSSGVTITCTPNLSSTSNSYFRSRNTGSWNATSTWQSSPDNITWINSTLVPTSSAAQIEIMNSHVVTINSSGVSMTNTFVRNGGILEVTTTDNYTISGSSGGRNIQLTVDNGGILSVKNIGSPVGNGLGLIKTGGKISADGGLIQSTFISDYIHYDNGLCYFENASICEWNIERYPSSNGVNYDTLFYPSNTGDLPIFRISNLPANQGYGNSNNDNIINAILELNTTIPFEIHNNTGGSGQKNVHIIGGIRGNGTFIQKTSAGIGEIYLGNTNHVPELGGNITIQIRTNRLKLPNGANVTTGSNVIIERNDALTQNGLIDRQGGILDVNAGGILDITNMRITNTATGGVTVNGTLRTANTGGLYDIGSAIVTGSLILNNNSTIDYYATLDQAISSIPNYYNIIFSGAGTKTPQNAVSVNTNGTVRITGTPTINFMLNNLASTGTNNTAFIMDGGRLRLGTTGTQPNMQGDYTLTGGIVEFTNTSITGQSIRSPKSYQNIEVTGNNVSNSNGNITLNDNGSFTVKTGGIFTINDDAIVGPTGNQIVTVENGAIFKTGDIHGFNGGNGISTTSVRSDIENIVLDNGSIVEYSRGNPFPSGNQTITHFSPAYKNLHISGSGIKTLQHNTATRVNENLEVLSGNTATLLVEEGKVITVKQAVKVPSAIGDAKFEIKNNGQLIQIDDRNIANLNSGTNFFMERKADVTTDDYVYWSSPTDGFSVNLIPNSGLRYQWDPIKYNSNNETQGNWVLPTILSPETEPNMSIGKGYIVRVPSSIYEIATNFKGTPRNGTVPVKIYRGSRTTAGTNVTQFDDNWNLIGNPYPSAISALEFLQTNGGNLVDSDPSTPTPTIPPTTIVGAVWIWKHGIDLSNDNPDPFYYNFVNNYDTTDYIKFNGTGSTDPAFNGFIGAGQGFMISMRDNPGTNPNDDDEVSSTLTGIYKPYENTVFFNNSMRVDDSQVHYNNSQFFRTGNTENNIDGDDEKHRIWLDIINTASGQTDTALMGYVSNATMSEDNLYDAFFVPRGEVSLYSLINTKSYIIQGRSLPFDTNDLVPLGMKIISAGNHTIAIRQVDGLFEGNQNIYLEDKQLNIIHDLKQNPYHFTSPTGVFNDRFILRYTTSALGNADFDYDNQVVVFSKNSTISINSSIQNIEEVQVYDVLGRTLYQNKSIDNQMHSFTKDIATQTIIVKVKLQNGVWITKKVLLK